MPVNVPAYSVKLANVGLLVVPGTLQEYAITPFAPRISLENPSHGTLDAYQSQTWDDWQHGIGFTRPVDSHGFNLSEGNVDSRQAGALSLYTQLATTGSIDYSVNVLCDYGGKLYAGLSGNASDGTNSSSLWYFDPTLRLWTAEATASHPTTAIEDLLVIEDNSGNSLLLIALSSSSDVVYQYWDGAAYTTGLANGYAKRFALAGGYVWYATRKNKVSYTPDPTTAGAWANELAVGQRKHVINSIVEFAGELWIGKTNGLYRVTFTNGVETVVPVLTFNTEASVNNCASLAVWQSFLYFSIGNMLYRISPSGGLADSSPPRFDIQYPYANLVNLRSLTPGRKFLYYTAQHNRTMATWLCCFDGVGHHHLATLSTNSANVAGKRALYWSTADGEAAPKLWSTLDISTTPTATVGYFPMNQYSDLPYGSFPVSGTHYLETSAQDFSLPDVVKDYRDVQIELVKETRETHTGATWVDDATVGTVAWIGTGDLTARGSTSGTEADRIPALLKGALATSHYLKGTGFGFTIPTGATITGVKVEIETMSTGHPSDYLFWNSIKLVKGGAIAGNEGVPAGTPYFNMMNTTAEYWQFGGETDLWGLTLTPADVNASNFGAVFSVRGLTNTGPPGPVWNPAGINYVAITVYYAYGVGTPQLTSGQAAISFALDSSLQFHSIGTVTAIEAIKTLSFPRGNGKATATGANTLTDSARIEADNYWNDALLTITSGKGVGQQLSVLWFSAGVFTLVSNWTVQPDTTSRYLISFSARRIRFRVTLSTTVVGLSPIMRAMSLRFVPLPELKRGWRMAIQGADTLESNSGNQLITTTAEQLHDVMNALRNAKGPVPFVNYNGDTFDVLVTDVQVATASDNPQKQLMRGMKGLAFNVTLAQA